MASSDPNGHVWRRPPPGAGPSSNPICAKCGVRRSVVDPNDDCAGRSPEAAIETLHDYDPMEGT